MSLFEYKEFKLEYKTEGSGPSVLLCFHGFGQNMHAWDCFIPVLKERFTIYSFSFFHHGNSVYPESRISQNTLRPDELKEIMAGFFVKKNIDRFSLMGYSMGAKISFQLLHFFGERIDSVTLWAPDGIYRNLWYNFTSKNKFGNFLYKRIINDPENLFAVMKMFTHFHWLSDKLNRFVRSNLETKEKRQMVYDVWMTMRHIDPSAKKSAEIILKYNIACILIFGKYDKVITPELGKKFNAMIEGNGKLIIAECGHNLLIPRNAEIIMGMNPKASSENKFHSRATDH